MALADRRPGGVFPAKRLDVRRSGGPRHASGCARRSPGTSRPTSASYSVVELDPAVLRQALPKVSDVLPGALSVWAPLRRRLLGRSCAASARSYDLHSPAERPLAMVEFRTTQGSDLADPLLVFGATAVLLAGVYFL